MTWVWWGLSVVGAAALGAGAMYIGVMWAIMKNMRW